jgi:acetyl esterase
VLDPQIEAVLAGMLAAPGPPAHEIPVAQARVNHAAEAAELCGTGPDVDEERELAIPGPGGEIPLRTYRAGDEAASTVVLLHGGGWMLGTLDTYAGLARALAVASGALVVTVDYRLAPEHPFPAGLDDCLAAVRWAAERGPVALVGDSAGGNLAAVVARRLRGEADLRLQALVYPVTDAGVNTPSYTEFGDRYGLTAASMQRFWRLYLDGADGSDPDASPLRAEGLAGVAPAYVLTADHDVLRDEGEAYAAALERAGVPVTLRRWPGTLHGFIRWLAATDIAQSAVDELGGELRAALA